LSPAPQVCPPEGAGLVDINELSRRLSIPKGTLYNLVYLRRIPFVKRGRSLRFDPAEVLRSLPRFGMIGSAGKG
jgi:excisionase family DNA binding protein